MPDYLGKDQRKLRDDESKEEKPFQGTRPLISYKYHYYTKFISCANYIDSDLNFAVFKFLALDEGDIELLKTYVSSAFSAK